MTLIERNNDSLITTTAVTAMSLVESSDIPRHGTICILVGVFVQRATAIRDSKLAVWINHRWQRRRRRRAISSFVHQF